MIFFNRKAGQAEKQGELKLTVRFLLMGKTVYYESNGHFVTLI